MTEQKHLKLSGICSVFLLLAACAQSLPIQKIYSAGNQVIYAFDARFEGSAFGYVQGQAKQHCQGLTLDQIAVLVNQTKTLNGISYAEFWCLSPKIEGIPPRELPQLTEQQTRKLLGEQGALPADPLPRPLR